MALPYKLWGASEVDSAIEEFQSVSKNDGSDLASRWSEILEEPHSRGCVKVVLAVTIRQYAAFCAWNSFPHLSCLIDCLPCQEKNKYIKVIVSAG